MDRLPTLTFWVLVLAACGNDAPPTAPPPARFEAVTARREDPGARFCDVSAPEGQGHPLTLPAMEGAPVPSSGLRWINVWATWCAPCVEEIPRIVDFTSRLRAEHVEVQTAFVSVDQNAEAIPAFRSAHPATPDTARLTDPGGLPTLLAALGLDAGATIPIHALVDSAGKLRCVRTGSISEQDYDTMAAILKGR